LNFIESYESPDGKKHCCLDVLPDSSVVILPNQQDESINRVSDVSIQLSQDQSSIDTDTVLLNILIYQILCLQPNPVFT